MKPLFTKKMLFISKSLIWAGILYVVCMGIINWADTTRGGSTRLDVAKNISLPQVPVINAAAKANTNNISGAAMSIVKIIKAIF